jgi:polyhydroxyalkanoate synthesis regulator protein
MNTGWRLPHKFLRRLLHYYGVELQHLNPNGVQHISTFIVLCEGYLGIEPYFKL